MKNATLVISFIFKMVALCVVDDPEGVVWRERAARIYRLISYYLAVVTSEFPAQLLIASVFFVIAYWMTNLMPTAWHFFGTWLIILLLMFPSQVILLLEIFIKTYVEIQTVELYVLFYS